MKRYSFASDNTVGMCDESLAALVAANQGDQPSYGDDRYTAEAADGFRALFGCNCDVYFVFNGTAANALALASLCQSYHSVITPETAHIETDECGAPAFFSNGTRLLLARQNAGKIDCAEIGRIVGQRHDIHYPKPKVVSISQSTELGTVYAPAEVREVARVARDHGLALHMDGSRLANAVASLGVDPAEITSRAGVDVVCFGGTKNGIGVGEAVIFFNHAAAAEFAYRCKQAGQLASKMRFLAAPWAAALRSGQWLCNARHANACAQQLAEGLRALPGVEVLHPVESNAVFVAMPEALHAGLQARDWCYYRFIGGGARFMCSWRTTEAEIQALLTDLRMVAADATPRA